MKIAITGHRPNKLGNDYNMTSPLMVAIRARIIEIVMKSTNTPDELTFITGMALGIDTLFATIAINMQIPFIAALPCKVQHVRWPKQAQDKYFDILSKAYSTTLISEQYTPMCMQQRNEWMVNNCDMLIAVWDGTRGGTMNCVQYAEKVNKPIKFINPLQIKNVAVCQPS